jgi:hypothetical protein
VCSSDLIVTDLAPISSTPVHFLRIRVVPL